MNSLATESPKLELVSNTPPAVWQERQITSSRRGHILTNVRVWSPDSQWIVYDTRSDAAGDVFDGQTIEMVNIHDGAERVLYRARHGACCGVVTFHPSEPKVAFILGPEYPVADWQYSAWHRRGVLVDIARPGSILNIDARDITPPFTPGALRGGTHLHVWNSPGDWLSFTYEDHVLAQFQFASPTNEINTRNIGVSVVAHPVHVNSDHLRNHDGDFFSVLVTRTIANPSPGSDDIKRASEESWIGTNGYVRSDGSRQNRALAFQGQVVAVNGQTVAEVFVADLPEQLTQAGAGPLGGTKTQAPFPPQGVLQRRVTFTTERTFPGLQGPRHWLQSSPDGTRIAFLMKDDAGVVQLWTVSPNSGPIRQLTRNQYSIASAFTWHPNGSQLAHVMDNCVCLTDATTGTTIRLTRRSDAQTAPRPEACVFSPDGRKITFIRRILMDGQFYNQICLLLQQP